MENRWLWRSGGALLFIYSYFANLKTSGPRRNRIFWSDGLAPGCWSLHADIQSSSWERRSCDASVASNFHCQSVLMTVHGVLTPFLFLFPLFPNRKAWRRTTECSWTVYRQRSSPRLESQLKKPHLPPHHLLRHNRHWVGEHSQIEIFLYFWEFR